MNSGRGHEQRRSSSGSRSPCQSCGKYAHVVVDCWHRFYETFTPISLSSNMHAPSSSTDLVKTSITDTQAIEMMAHSHQYYLKLLRSKHGP